MPIYKDPKKLKKLINQTNEQYNRYNNWERQLKEKPDVDTGLAAVFELYDMIPDNAKHRAVDVKGIMKMRKGLACLKLEYCRSKPMKT